MPGPPPPVTRPAGRPAGAAAARTTIIPPVPGPTRTPARTGAAGSEVLRRHQPLRLRGPRSKVWKAVVAGLGVFVLLAVCGLASYFIVVDEQAGIEAANGANAGPSVVPRDISSRDVDPAPLTVAEVFPGKEIVIVEGQPTYRVLTTQVAADCRVGATEQLLAALVKAGCNQVVRATMRSPTGAYLVTSGIFNLASQEVADQLHDAVKPLVDAEKGRFTGLIAGKGTEPIVRSSTHLGWGSRGHYLTFSVIARVDGKEFTAKDDPHARQIIYDMLMLHLRNVVLEKRATVQPSATAATGG